MLALKKYTTSKELNRFLRFAIIGMIGTLVDFGLLIVFKEVFGFPTLRANILSYSAGIVNNFILNRLWTFSEAREKHVMLQLTQFVVVSLIGLGLNTLIVISLEDLMPFSDMGYITAKIIATGFVLLWNFIANRLWTFSDVEA